MRMLTKTLRWNIQSDVHSALADTTVGVLMRKIMEEWRKKNTPKSELPAEELTWTLTLAFADTHPCGGGGKVEPYVELKLRAGLVRLTPVTKTRALSLEGPNSDLDRIAEVLDRTGELASFREDFRRYQVPEEIKQAWENWRHLKGRVGEAGWKELGGLVFSLLGYEWDGLALRQQCVDIPQQEEFIERLAQLLERAKIYRDGWEAGRKGAPRERGMVFAPPWFR